MPDLSSLFSHSPIPVVLMGAALAYGMYDVQARGLGSWLRHGGVALVVVVGGGWLTWTILRSYTGFGGEAVLTAALGAGGVTWLTVGVLTLWRNNLLLATILDWPPFYLLASVGLMGGLVYFMTTGLPSSLSWWAWGATPILAGAFHRLCLVLDYWGWAPSAQSQLDRQIEMLLTGSQGEGRTIPLLFRPRQMAQRVRQASKNLSTGKNADLSERLNSLGRKLLGRFPSSS